jgi:hypothetical protein
MENGNEFWYFASLRPVSVQKVARELPKYGLEYVRTHEVGWDKGDLNKQMNIVFSIENKMKIISKVQEILGATKSPWQ